MATRYSTGNMCCRVPNPDTLMNSCTVEQSTKRRTIFIARFILWRVCIELGANEKIAGLSRIWTHRISSYPDWSRSDETLPFQSPHFDDMIFHPFKWCRFNLNAGAHQSLDQTISRIYEFRVFFSSLVFDKFPARVIFTHYGIQEEKGKRQHIPIEHISLAQWTPNEREKGTNIRQNRWKAFVVQSAFLRTVNR